MAPLTLYELRPRSATGFHFGEQGLELETSRITFPSDSLFSALVATIAAQEGAEAAETFLRPFVAGDPPFLLTSLFPYIGELPLLPLPQLRLRPAEAVPPKFSKDVQFVSPSIFAQICRAESVAAFLPPDEEKETGDEGRFLQENAVWISAAEQVKLPDRWKGFKPAALNHQQVWHQGNVPRVVLDRVSSSSTIYQMGRVTFNEGCGLWLGVDYRDEAHRTRLESLLRHLGDRGIGGERSNGYGAYELVVENPLALNDLPEQGNGPHLLLSRYLPTLDELDNLRDPRAAYRLVTVGGWLQSPDGQSLRRKQLTLLAEGSVVGGKVLGRVEKVTPDKNGLPDSVNPPSHEIYRSGLTCTVPVTVKEAT